MSYVTQCTSTEEIVQYLKSNFSKPFPLVLCFFLPPRQDILVSRYTSIRAYPDGVRQAQAVWLRETRQDGLSVPSSFCHR